MLHDRIRKQQREFQLTLAERIEDEIRAQSGLATRQKRWVTGRLARWVGAAGYPAEGEVVGGVVLCVNGECVALVARSVHWLGPIVAFAEE